MAERRKYSQAEHLELTTQVGGVCPLCGDPLFYRKGNGSFKCYDLAHIYPLNPTPPEIEELRNEVRLHEDVNNLDNLIPLCVKCHTKYDKPRTAEEYKTLVALKLELIRLAEQQKIQLQYQIEDDIEIVIAGLYKYEALPQADLEYDPKRVDEKFDESMPFPTRQKIKHNVTDYYQFIRATFLEIEGSNPNSTNLIFTQVRAFYLKQKSLGLSQPEIFANIVAWFLAKAKPQTVDAAEIVASFFIQNCEVFE